jgi:hypothetical protein
VSELRIPSSAVPGRWTISKQFDAITVALLTRGAPDSLGVGEQRRCGIGTRGIGAGRLDLPGPTEPTGRRGPTVEP